MANAKVRKVQTDRILILSQQALLPTVCLDNMPCGVPAVRYCVSVSAFSCAINDANWPATSQGGSQPPSTAQHGYIVYFGFWVPGSGSARPKTRIG